MPRTENENKERKEGEKNQKSRVLEGMEPDGLVGEPPAGRIHQKLVRQLQEVTEALKGAPVSPEFPIEPTIINSIPAIQKDETRKVSATAKLREKASSGIVEAQAHLGHAYLIGAGIIANLEEASKWLLMAAKSEHDAGLWARGLCFLMGIGGMGGARGDPSEALACFKKGADRNFAPALVSLARCYINGRGVSVDVSKAVPYYLLAVKQGYAPAQSDLGWCYENGFGVKEDHKEAVHLYSLAAAQEDVQAQFSLGICYEEGRGIAKDLGKAKEYYARAAQQGHERAEKALKNCNHSACSGSLN